MQLIQSQHLTSCCPASAWPLCQNLWQYIGAALCCKCIPGPTRGLLETFGLLLLQLMKLIQSQLKLSTSEVAVLPVHGLSAKTGQGTEALLPAAMQLYDVWNKRITTSRLNSWREKVIVHYVNMSKLA